MNESRPKRTVEDLYIGERGLYRQSGFLTALESAARDRGDKAVAEELRRIVNSIDFVLDVMHDLRSQYQLPDNGRHL
jgi:hypothetical protein